MFHCIQFSGELMTKKPKEDEVISEWQRQESEKEKIGDQVRKVVNNGALREALEHDDLITTEMANWIIDAIDDKFIRLTDEKAKRCPECLIPTRTEYKRDRNDAEKTTMLTATGTRFCPRCKTRYRMAKDERGTIKLIYEKVRQ
jgi:hypothetical protein